MQKAYYQNSKKFHPDFHSLADDEKQAWAMENATINNAAFTTLSDPDKRIRYILELKGLLSDESQQPALPPAFLMEMMDINEAIMDLQMDFDAARFEKTIAEVEKTENQLLQSVKEVMENYTDDGTQEESLEKVKNYFLKKKYLLRIRENLSNFASAS